MAFAAICCLAFTQCSDFLDTSSPSNIDDEFVSSSPTETLKILSRGYALYRESCFGAYNWNDHFGSDIEYFPENNSSNNINAKLPLAYSENGYVSTLGIEDGSYLRLNTLTLGYTLPKQFIKKAGISNLRVYGSIYNVFTITGYSGLDAEVNTNTSTSDYPKWGLDWGTYPRARSFLSLIHI